MNELTNELTNKRTNERMNEGPRKGRDGRTNGRGNLDSKLLKFPDPIVSLKFGFYGETKTGTDSSRKNIILNDSDM